MCRLSRLQGFESFLYLFLELPFINPDLTPRLILDLTRDSVTVKKNVSALVPKLGLKQRAGSLGDCIDGSRGSLVR